MKIRTIALMLTVVAVASLAAGQPAERVEVRLKAAMHQALVDGDLQAAIEQYADIVARAGGNRTVAAQALLQMGHAYEKLAIRWRKYLILLSFLDNPRRSGYRRTSFTGRRERRRSSSQSPPRPAGVDAQNAPTAPWKTLCVFQSCHPRKTPKSP